MHSSDMLYEIIEFNRRIMKQANDRIRELADMGQQESDEFGRMVQISKDCQKTIDESYWTASL